MPALISRYRFIFLQLANNFDPEMYIALLQAVGSVCRQAGHRFGEHVERVMPLVLAYAKVDDDELREHCLQACEFELGDTECFMYL